MDKQALVDVIVKTDLDLKIRQNDSSLDPQTRTDVDVARVLLWKLKSGVVRGSREIWLRDSWSLSALGLVQPAISAVEAHGIPVLYQTGIDRPTPRHPTI